MDAEKPLWTCPDCAQRFVSPRMAHSCVRRSEADFFAGKPAQHALFRAFLAFVERHGPVAVNVNKTRISLQGRARFAAVNRITRDGLSCHLWLKRRREHPLFGRIDRFGAGDWVHNFRLTDAGQLDAAFADLVAEAYAVGMQRWTSPAT